MKQKLLTRFTFQALHQISKMGHRTFKNALNNVEQVQRQKLSLLLINSEKTHYAKKYGLHRNLSWEDFDKVIPAVDYTDLADLINQQKNDGGSVISGGVCKRYQPTSGSTSTIKWIPYSDLFLSELDRAVSPLIVDNFSRNKKLMTGKQYWSLSWIPTDLRKDIDPECSDDITLLPWWKRYLYSHTMAVPNEISYASTSDGSMMATLAYLASTRDLVLLSVWSPTFALNLFENIKIYKEELSEILEAGNWCNWQNELSFISCPKSPSTAALLRTWDGTINSDFISELWPQMAVVSSWDTSTAEMWAQDLKNLFPNSDFQGKGLWATEGIVTLPFEEKFPLAVTSHFYEFQDIETGKIHPSWALEKDQIVKPLLSTGSGFFRYALNDRIQVVDFIDQCPCFKFLGRINGVDMVGEKMSPEIAINIMNKVSDKFNIRPVSLLAITCKKITEQKPHYLLLCEENNLQNNIIDEVSTYTENILNKSFHYKLARDHNVLEHAKSIFTNNARELYQKNFEGKNMIAGNIKIEPLALLNNFKNFGFDESYSKRGAIL